jgi:glutamine amidotransferase
MSPRIVVVNYLMGNLGSIGNMLHRIGYASVVSSDAEEISQADKLILPGVGHFDRGMEQLAALGLIDVLARKVLEDKTPVLGICLGMQLLGARSEEGARRGLGWIDADFVRFRPADAEYEIKIPQMTWNYTKQRKPSQLMDAMLDRPRFYFVHAYHAVMKHPEDTLLTTHYGYEYTAAFERENILGVQFHPEKSHKFGMLLLKNFVERY